MRIVATWDNVVPERNVLLTSYSQFVHPVKNLMREWGTHPNLGIGRAFLGYAMNSANPFQIPTCFQNVDEQRKRERFKKGVIAAIAAIVLLLVGLLIQGCKSERANAMPAAQVAAAPKTSPIPVSSPSAGVMPQPVSNVPKASMTPAINHSETVYVVKSGDTLSRIAKTHGVSLKALKAANSIDNDHIAVGTKLKIPTA